MSTKLRLSLACGDYEITRPLIDGSVKPDGIELTGVYQYYSYYQDYAAQDDEPTARLVEGETSGVPATFARP